LRRGTCVAVRDAARKQVGALRAIGSLSVQSAPLIPVIRVNLAFSVRYEKFVERHDSDHARFALPEAKRGNGAHFANVVLPRVIRSGLAYETHYLGEDICAEDARPWAW